VVAAVGIATTDGVAKSLVDEFKVAAGLHVYVVPPTAPAGVSVIELPVKPLVQNKPALGVMVGVEGAALMVIVCVAVQPPAGAV